MRWVQASNLADAVKVPLISRIRAEALQDLVIVFNTNGIRKKSN